MKTAIKQQLCKKVQKEVTYNKRSSFILTVSSIVLSITLEHHLDQKTHKYLYLITYRNIQRKFREGKNIKKLLKASQRIFYKIKRKYYIFIINIGISYISF